MIADCLRRWGSTMPGMALLAPAVASWGCSATHIGFAMHIAGEAVNDVDVQQRSKESLGGPVSQADAKLGAPIEILSENRLIATQLHPERRNQVIVMSAFGAPQRVRRVPSRRLETRGHH